MLISIIGVVIVLSIVILSHEVGHFLMAKKMGVRVEVFSLGLGPKIWSLKKGETEYVLSLIPFGGYVKMAGDEPGEDLRGEEWEFSSKPIYKRFNIVVAGAAVNYILGFILFCVVFMIGAPVLTSRIGEVMEGYPAQKSGVEQNDRILEINGKSIKHWDEVLNIIRNSKENEISILVDRNGERLNLAIESTYGDIKDIFGRPIRVIGIRPSGEQESIRYGFFGAIDVSSRTVWNITALTYRAIWGILTGALSLKMVSGPVGILAATGQAAKMGMVPLLQITALISVSLAIFNLLPFPILDGGHILFLGIEKLKGRPIDKNVQENVQQVALILLILFVLVVSWNDIIRYFAK